MRLIAARYRLLRRIGEGAMGEVYEAEHVDLGRRYAVKVARSLPSLDEARTVAATIGRHPNIVDVTDCGIDPETSDTYMVMELLEGEALGSYIARQGCPPRQTLRTWLQHIGAALTAAHEAGVIHRDMKPANIFICSDGTVKLLDFGISKMLTGADGTATEACTPFYGAPEQLGEQVREHLEGVARVVQAAYSGRSDHPFRCKPSAGSG